MPVEQKEEKDMSSWLNDPWVVGIGGGILSGLIVTYISRAILSKRDNKEYRQKVATANQEILYAIRPCISEGTLPNRKVMMRIVTATARKYEVDRKDLLSVLQIIQNLTKEVMDSSFISVKAKTEYCNLLSQMVEPTRTPERPSQGISDIEFKRLESRDYTEYRTKMISMISMMTGIMTALMTIMAVFLKQPAFDKVFVLDKSSELMTVIMPAMISLLTIVIASFTYVAIRGSKKKNIITATKKVGDTKNPKEDLSNEEK